ncbi:MAG: phosphoribosylamine--glycine ligase, partial [Saprospiraceae bacterium]|nr:phosphoribosylamine--glycine ligase [Saprospiraceae bacterium]
TGPNTGGMGAISPVPFVDEAMWEKVEKRIIQPTVAGLQQENITYHGFIFFGLISVQGEPVVIEYNCRLGDPETEAVIPRLKNDLVQLFDLCARGKLEQAKIRTDERVAATIFLVSGGYPGDYMKGKAISGLDKVKGSLVFHAGTTDANPEAEVRTNGGRVLAITSFGTDIAAAIAKSKRTAKVIQFAGKTYRRDIGQDLQ